MKLILSIWVLMLWYFASHGQTVIIKSKTTSEPLIGATVTDENESFAIANAHGVLNAGQFVKSKQIEVRCLGYQTLTTSYTLIKQQNHIIYLSPSNLSLDEVVISGTRWRQASKDIPSKIISIKPADVALLNPQTAADLLGVSGKVFIQKSQQGGGSPMIRGFAANRLLYTVDGVRMNNAIFRGGNLQNVINIDPFTTEQTEVLFGPGSVIYGSDAIGGVMSFKTLTPSFSTTNKPNVIANLNSRYSTANREKTGHVDVNIGLKKWAFISSISYWNYQNLIQGKNGPTDYIKPYYVARINGIDSVINQENELLQIPTAYNQLNTLQKIRFKPNQKCDLQYGFHYSETSNYGRYDRHNRLKNELPRYAEWYYGPQKWLMHNLSVSYLAKKALFDEIAIRLANQKFNESRMSRNLNSDYRNEQYEQVNAYSSNIDFEKHINNKSKIFYGFEYVFNKVNSTGTIIDISNNQTSQGLSRYPKSTWNSAALYLSNEYKINEKTTIQSGIRYNKFIINSTFDTSTFALPFTTAYLNQAAITGSIGATYRPNATLILKSGYGTAFRAPNVDDIGKVFDSEPGAVTIPNPNLRAEYAHNIDVSLAKVIRKKIKLDFTAYYTLLNHAIIRRDYELNGQDSIMYMGQMSKVQALQNAAQGSVAGLQIGIEANLNQRLSFSSDLNLQKGTEEMENGAVSPSRHAAPLFGTSRLTYKYKKINVLFYSIYQATRNHQNLSIDERGKDEIYAKDANGNTFAPAWYTINIKSQYRINDVFTINCGLENITNQRYRPYSSGVSAAGRNLIISAKATY
ncbi:MAG: TonB-dependent receptor [Bacteroidia bacterium]